MNFTQEYNDVKDKLGDLIPWLEKLLDTLAKVNPDNDREEVERRSQLAKFVSCLGFLVHLYSMTDRWKTSESDRWHCQKRERSLGFWISREICKRSSGSWKNSGKLSSSTRLVRRQEIITVGDH